MGQYHFPVNWDKREFIHPHELGDGLKLLEFGCSMNGTMTGLALLLAGQNKGEARGGGDLHPWHGGPGYEGRENPLIVSEEYEQKLMDHVVGRWAGDRISILGDYHDEHELYCDEQYGSPWYESARDHWTNISGAVVQAMCLDYYVRGEVEKQAKHYGRGGLTDSEHIADRIWQHELIVDGKIIEKEVKA